MNTAKKLFDLSLLEDLDDDGFITEIITIYLQDTDIALKEMKQAFNNGSIETIEKTAHKLKSSTGMLQANDLFATLDNTEKIAKEGKKMFELAELLQNAKYEFGHLKAALESHMQGTQLYA